MSVTATSIRIRLLQLPSRAWHSLISKAIMVVVVVGAGLLMIMKQSMLAQLFEPLMIILRRRYANLY